MPGGFDKSLDKELFSETKAFETTKITVAVFSYNHGTPKLQISRENLNPENAEWKFSKVGRMFKDEVEAVMEMIPKALPFLEEKKEED